MASYLNVKQSSSFGALKSVKHHHCVPDPSSDTIISLPPNQRCLIPLMTLITNLKIDTAIISRVLEELKY
jgi:hypothetical protein